MIEQPKASARIELEGPDFVNVENYRKGKEKIPSRADAILELIRKGLASLPAQTAAEPRKSAAV